MTQRRLALVLAPVLGLAAMPFLLPASQAQEGAPPPPAPLVVVAAAEERQMAETVTVPGSVVSRNDSEIAAEIGGVAATVAEIGSFVEAGGVIAEIDPELLALDMRRAEAAVKRLEARVKFLENEVERLEALAGKGSATRQKLDQARSERDMARQDLAEAKVHQERAALDLANAKVTTPFPGRVVARLVEPGEYIERGRPVARVVDTSALEVVAQIPIASVSSLKEGDQVSIEGPGGTVTAFVRALVPVGDQVSRSAELRAALTESAWLVGTAVKVATPTAAPQMVIAVPRDAVLLRADGHAIFKIGEGDVAELVQVTTGLVSGDRIAVTGAIKAGDRVVTRGAETLQPGQKVEIQAAVGAQAGSDATPG